jgi:hypothetical protein
MHDDQLLYLGCTNVRGTTVTLAYGQTQRQRHYLLCLYSSYGPAMPIMSWEGLFTSCTPAALSS